MTELLAKKFIKNYKDTENPSVRSAYGKFSSTVGIVLNFILFLIKIIIGTMSGSVSITADAVNNLSDASSSIISLFGFKLSEKPADKEHPYGHGRYEYLSGLTVSVLILVIGVELLKSAIDKIINPSDVTLSISLIVVLSLSILVKLWMVLFNRKISKKINSKTLEATACDSRNDCIATSAVLLSVIVSRFIGFDLDGIMGILVALFILISGINLIKETIDPMLGSAPSREYVEKIRDKILSYPGVLGMHDLIIHDYGPSRRFASVHVEMAAEDDCIKSHDVIDNIEMDCLNELGLNLIIHFDPILTKDDLTNDLRKQLSDLVLKIDEGLSIHDLRVVPGTTHTNLVFDCVTTFDLGLSDNELKNKISELVKELNPTYNCVITIDKGYAPVIG